MSLFGAVVYVVVSDIFVKESVMKTDMAIEKTAVEIGADIRHAKSLLQLLNHHARLYGLRQNGRRRGRPSSA